MKIRDLNALRVFRAVATSGGFTQAALNLGEVKSYVSRKIQELEIDLGTKLFQRSTRNVILTEQGRFLLEVSQRALEEVESAEATFEDVRDKPQGTLRVTCPVDFSGTLIEQVIKKFLDEFSQIKIDLLATNQILDLVKDEIDVAIRPGNLGEISHVGVRLGVMEWGLYASPSFISKTFEKDSPPDHPRDFDQVMGVFFNPQLQMRKDPVWVLHRNQKIERVKYQFSLSVSQINSLIDSGVSGMGIIALPDVYAQGYVQAGRLKRVLPEWTLTRTELFAFYLSKRGLPPRTRLFIDSLVRNLKCSSSS